MALSTGAGIALGGGISAGGTMLGNLVTAGSRKKERQLQKAQSDRNYEMQQRQVAYERQLQEELYRREDTAIQRKAADLKAAGLSKTLAAGSGADAGSVVSQTVPQENMNYDDSPGQHVGKGISEAAEMAMSMMRMKREFQQTDADIERTKVETFKSKLEARQKEQDMALYKKLGLPSNQQIPSLLKYRDAANEWFDKIPFNKMINKKMSVTDQADVTTLGKVKNFLVGLTGNKYSRAEEAYLRDLMEGKK